MHKTMILVDNWGPVYSKVLRVPGGRIYLNFCNNRRIPIVGYMGGWGELNWEEVAEASCCNWSRGYLHP